MLVLTGDTYELESFVGNPVLHYAVWLHNHLRSKMTSRGQMIITSIRNDVPEIPLNTLYSLHEVRPYYFLTKNNLIFNKESNSYCAVNIYHSGYPYVTVALGELGSNLWKQITLHKIIALARICNGSYECVEHVNDNPLDLRVKNLKFSNQLSNSRSSFINGHRDTPSALFRVELFDGRILEGTLKQIQESTGISRITLYDRFYKGPREFATNSRQKVKSVVKIGQEDSKPYTSNKSIDYRKGKFRGQIILDNLTIDFSTE